MTEKNKGLFERFDERKQAVEAEKVADEQAQTTSQSIDHIHKLEDKDMPDIDTLNADSDYSMFLSEKVSESLRKKALRKLFLSPEIDILDGLNEYDEDYTNFEALGNVVTFDMLQERKRDLQEILDSEDIEPTEKHDTSDHTNDAVDRVDVIDGPKTKDCAKDDLNNNRDMP